MLPLFPRHIAFPIALGAGLVTALAIGWADLPLTLKIGISANAMFVVYLAVVAVQLRRMTPEFLRRHADAENISIWIIVLVTVVVVGLSVSALFVAINSGGSPGAVAIGIGLVSAVLGWFVINTMAALHYAHEYYRSAPAGGGAGGILGGFLWPKGEEPNGVAFLYLSYQVGSALQIADVAATSNRMRGLLALHAVFAFLYNTLLVTAAINIVVAVAGG